MKVGYAECDCFASECCGGVEGARVKILSIWMLERFAAADPAL